MAITASQCRDFQSPPNQFCSPGYRHQSRHRQRTTGNQTADTYVSNPPYRDIRDSRYNDTIRDILIQATVLEKNIGNLLERLNWLRPDPDEMSWEPSNVVYMPNWTPAQEELDRMVEAKLLLVKDSKLAGAPMPTTSRIEGSCDNGLIIAAAEADRNGKEREGAPAFGCDSVHGSCFF